VVSSDGAQVPMFIVAPINITLDGNNPTMLYGYGGALLSPRRPCAGAGPLCMLCERCVGGQQGDGAVWSAWSGRGSWRCCIVLSKRGNYDAMRGRP